MPAGLTSKGYVRLTVGEDKIRYFDARVLSYTGVSDEEISAGQKNRARVKVESELPRAEAELFQGLRIVALPVSAVAGNICGGSTVRVPSEYIYLELLELSE